MNTDGYICWQDVFQGYRGNQTTLYILKLMVSNLMSKWAFGFCKIRKGNGQRPRPDIDGHYNLIIALIMHT